MAPGGHGDGDGAVMHPGDFGAVRGHVGRITDEGDAGHARFGGHLGVVAEGALVGEVTDERPADADFPGFLDNLFHGKDGGYRTESAVSFDEEGGRRFVYYPDIRFRVHHSLFNVFQVPGNPQHTV